MGRTLTLSFRSEGFHHGQVPLTIVADKLKALQNLVFHATATVAQDPLGRSGLWANRYRGVAELSFAGSHHSDLVIEATLPEAPHRDLLPPVVHGDLAAKAIELVFAVGRAATGEGDLERLVRVREDRLCLLKALQSLCPAPAEEYQIDLSNGAGPAGRLSFSPEVRQKLRRRTALEKAMGYGEEEITIVGQLTKIHVHTRPQLIAVRAGNQPEMHCYFDDTMLDQISNLVPGSLVEVTGWTITDAAGRMQINMMTDVETVSMEPLRLSRIEHEGHRYKLRQPLVVLVEYADGVWIYHNDDINLWGYAKRRADAVRELGAAFDYLYREIAQEDDAVLDTRARLIKERLLAMVKQQDAGGA